MDEILDAAPGLLNGRLCPEYWLTAITETQATEPAAASVEDLPLPKLTRDKRQLLVNIARNLMTSVNAAEPSTLDDAGSVWRDCLDQGAETIAPTSLPGSVASLTKKRLATTNGDSVPMTPLVFAAYRSVAAKVAASAHEATAEEAKPQSREGTKQATLIAMLRRREDADLDEIAAATGW